ncbi:stage III sporulation protein AH [Virgibacillus dakarensis]|nr:stage III sporulation protein AH [Virgibacillus dakarensis]
MYRVKINPENTVYKQLIDLAFNYCDTFHLVIRKDMGKIRDLKNFLSKLEPSLIELREESEWASTILDGETAYVYYYNTQDATTRDFIKNSVDSLYSWEQPELPEDLSFFKDGEVWLATSSHENECYILPTNQSEIKDLQNINGLELEKEEE